MLSKKAKHAIKILILLGKQAEGVLLSGSQIADLEKISKKPAEALLVELKKNGYLYNIKSASGGYKLLKRPEEILLVDIVRSMDGPIAQISCASAYHYHRCEECPIEETCSIRDLYLEIRAADLKILSGTSIADMMKKEQILNESIIAPQY